MNADAIIVAVGAEPVIPPIKGTDNKKVVGLDALKQKEPAVGQKVVILGAGHVGCEVGIYLDMLGKDVTIVEMRSDWAPDAYFMHKNAMNMYIRDSRIRIETDTTAKEITDAGLVCTRKDGSEVLFEADTVLLAAGLRAKRDVADSFYNCAPKVFQTGDAIKAARVVDATGVGHWTALEI